MIPNELKTDLMQEYIKELIQAPPFAFSLVAGINQIKKKGVGPVTPNPGNKNPIKPNTGDKKPDIGDKKTEIGQEGGKLLTKHQLELNAVLIFALVLVLSAL